MGNVATSSQRYVRHSDISRVHHSSGEQESKVVSGHEHEQHHNKLAKVRVHTYIHAYIHTYMHTCIHTYIHTYMQACQLVDGCILTGWWSQHQSQHRQMLRPLVKVRNSKWCWHSNFPALQETPCGNGGGGYGGAWALCGTLPPPLAGADLATAGLAVGAALLPIESGHFLNSVILLGTIGWSTGGMACGIVDATFTSSGLHGLGKLSNGTANLRGRVGGADAAPPTASGCGKVAARSDLLA